MSNEQLVPRTEIRYVSIGTLTIYLVSEDELRMIERGGPTSTLLTLGIFFASVGLSFWGSLALATPTSLKTFNIIVVIIVVCLVASIVLLTLWLNFRSDSKADIARIRQRAIPAQNTSVEHE